MNSRVSLSKSCEITIGLAWLPRGALWSKISYSTIRDCKEDCKSLSKAIFRKTEPNSTFNYYFLIEATLLKVKCWWVIISISSDSKRQKGLALASSGFEPTIVDSYKKQKFARKRKFYLSDFFSFFYFSHSMIFR